MPTDVAEPTPVVKRWGWKFGCDGTLRINEAIEFSGLSEKTLERRADQGLIRRGKSGSRLVLFCRRSLVEYLSTLEV